MESYEFLFKLNEYKTELSNCSLCGESDFDSFLKVCEGSVKLLILSDVPLEREQEGYVLLLNLIKSFAIPEEDYFISSIIKCKNVERTPENFKKCRRHLAQEFKLLKPKYILLLGSGAHEAFFGTRPDGNKIRGRISSVNGFNIMTTCNPIIAADNINLKLMMHDDMEKINNLLRQN